MKDQFIRQIRKIKKGYVGVYGVKGGWKKSCGIIRVTREDAKQDAEKEIMDLKTMARYQNIGLHGQATGIDPINNPSWL